jgi:hypothetical protein
MFMLLFAPKKSIECVDVPCLIVSTPLLNSCLFLRNSYQEFHRGHGDSGMYPLTGGRDLFMRGYAKFSI